MNTVKQKRNIKLKTFFEDKNRWVVSYGGAGSGKSYSAGQKLLVRLLEEENHKILVVRKVATTLRVSVFQLLKDLISDLDCYQYFKINKTDMTITNTLNNSMFLFFGLDDIEKLKSIQGITSIWIEEASECKQNDILELNRRLRGHTKYYKQIILTFNPISHLHWLKEHFFDNPHSKASIYKTTYLDNSFIDDEYKSEIEDIKNYDMQQYLVYALGEWGVMGELVYKIWRVVDDMPSEFEYEFFGMDYGFNNPSAIVHIRLIDRDLYIDEILYESQLTNNELITKLKNEHKELMNMKGFGDTAPRDNNKEFVKAGFNVSDANKDVEKGIDFVKSFNLHVTRHSQNIQKELSLYKYKKDKDGNVTDTPAKAHDHSLDALRYATYTGLFTIIEAMLISTNKEHKSSKGFNRYAGRSNRFKGY